MKLTQSLLISAPLLALTCSLAPAQWSIGAAGNRMPPPGKHRYIHCVFSNPLPGLENEYNDWYTNTHMGDLVQLPGWVGAQRFRIVSDVDPRPTIAGYDQGYLIIFELEDETAVAPIQRMSQAIAGGKSRRGAGFNYYPGAGPHGTYEVMGARITRPDGKGPTMPDPLDFKTVRLSRYVLMQFEEALPGKEAEFNKAAEKNIPAMLGLPGWLAVQRFHVADTPGRVATDRTSYLTIWEIEGRSAKGANDALNEALKTGVVKKNPASDESKAQIVYWEPMSPHVTRDDFQR